MAWMNDDGLYVKFGTDRADVANGGEYNVLGGDHWVEFDLDMASVASATAIINDVVTIPALARIHTIDVLVLTATEGTNSNLNLGLTRYDRTTAIDADGLLAAADAWHTAAAGTMTRYQVGTTEAGVLVGVSIGANPGYIAAHYDTGAFTAGLLRIRLYWTKVPA
jgi:hypothetical protein